MVELYSDGSGAIELADEAQNPHAEYVSNIEREQLRVAIQKLPSNIARSSSCANTKSCRVDYKSMTQLLTVFFSWFGAFFRSRNDLGLELVALRHQLAVLRHKNPRPRLSGWDRLFWLTLRCLWPKWSGVLLIVTPETVVGWHRAGFRW
jgi:hypothetical protein